MNPIGTTCLLSQLAMNLQRELDLNLTRRHFFGRSALGIGTAALSSLLARDGIASAPMPPTDHGVLGTPHIAPKAKRIVYLFMSGAPSQFETFDYKPTLHDMFGVDLPGLLIDIHDDRRRRVCY